MSDAQSFGVAGPLGRDCVAARDGVAQRLAALKSIDVLIVGAGINGCAVFRELALQGLTCLLIDQEDFGAGASSASTRMAHGGLRYLENGEFRLVAEATRERNRLLRNAAHTIHPLQVSIPSFSVFGGLIQTIGKLFGIQRIIRSRGLVMLRLGLMIYDLFSQRQAAMPSHRVLTERATRALLPDLHPAVRGLVSYYDASVSHAERVAFELVDDGMAADHRSLAVNHCALVGAKSRDVILRDLVGNRDHVVTPRLVINATGAWIDAVNGRLGPMRELIGGTKGSHLIIDNPALHRALRGRAFSFDDGEGRMCITYPLGSKVLLGSTDIRVADPDTAICDAAEIDYLIGAIRVIFPRVDVQREQICFRFCGVRPLPRSTGLATVNISRDHVIARREPDGTLPFPVLSLVGGKWTTFRAFAEQVADQVLTGLGGTRRCGTQDLSIGGGRDYPITNDARTIWLSRVAAATHCPVGQMDLWLTRYGTRAERVARFCMMAPDRNLGEASEYTCREILFLVQQEHAVTLADIIYRRTTIAISGLLTFALLCEIAVIVGVARDVSPIGLVQDVVPRLLRENGIDFIVASNRFAATYASPDMLPEHA